MHFIHESIINAAPERVFAFHELPDAFQRLIPPWENCTILQKADISRVGSRAIVEQKVLGLIRIRWVAEHTRYEPPQAFEDVQVSGPFKQWRHQHLVLRHKDGAILRDEIDFIPPFGIFGRIGARLLIVPRLKRMFTYRHEATRQWAERREPH